jgi:hypothetical protein
VRRPLVSDELWDAIARAERAAREAHDLAYREPCSYWLRAALGRAQSILMTWVVRQARDPGRRTTVAPKADPMRHGAGL